MLDLSIVVLHYNYWDLTMDCLASINTQPIPCAYEKVLVDNGSTGPLLHSTLTDATGWRVVRYEDNRGHIVGQNRCFESAHGQWVLFVANDVRLESDCIKNLWSSRKEISQPFLWTTQTQFDNAGLMWIWPGYGYSTATTRPDTIAGSCYLMPKETWRRLGGFDELLQTSHEDIDFSLRAKQRQYSIHNVVDASAIHRGNATLKHSSTHTRTTFHRDRVYVVKKHYRGFDRWLRLLCITLLDSLSSLYHQLV